MNDEKDEMVHVSVTISGKALRLLDDFTRRKSLSRSSVIRLLILESLSKKSGVIEK